MGCAGIAVRLEIPGVINLQTQTISEGYETKEEFSDEIGNIGLTVFSGYSKTIAFTGFLAKDAGTTTPYVGMEVTMEGWTAYIDSGFSIAYGPRAATVSGTIKAYKALTSPNAS